MTSMSDDRRACLASIEFALRTYLRLEEDTPVDPRRSFLEYGFDSLMAVEFRDVLAARFDRSLPSTLLFDHPNPEALVGFLVPTDTDSTESLEPAALSEADPEDLDEASLRELVQRQAAQLRVLEDRATEPIAVVGIGCRLPGGVEHPDDLAALLEDGRDAIIEVPDDRWDRDAFYDPDQDAPGRIHCRSGGFLEGGIRGFDAAMFGISPREAIQLDPQQRLLLETTWHALEHAGIAPESWRGERIGVFVGMRASEYFDSQCSRGPEDAESYYATGNALSTAAGRLSYTFGWTGPCFALDTACSSSLVAVHEAVQSLRQGDCSAALAAGVNLLIDPLSSISICKAHMLAADGRCKTFDASADGYGRAEGCGVVVLKRVSHARRDGDRILGLIRGSAINQDGASAGLTVPHGPSQEAVVRAALLDGRLEPGDVDYVEAHGTGTELGDPIEVGALDAVFGTSHAPGGLVAGSVKTNLGHLECAAGIAGLIKVLVCLDTDQLPSHLHLENPNPHIDWDATVVRVPTSPTPWPDRGRARRAGVSSFGFSGTNAHVVVEQEVSAPVPVPASAPQLLPLSARDPEALKETAEDAARWLRGHPGRDLRAVCATAARGRARLPQRIAVIGDTSEDLASALDHAAGSADRGGAGVPRVALLFTGQGAQHPGMTRELYDTVPVYREHLDQAVAALAPHLDTPLLDVLFGADDRVHETRWTQPCLFATGYAMARTWQALGIEPAVVAGHSIGEITAATVAGLCSLEDGARWIAARARGMQDTAPGAMVAIQGDPAWVERQVAADPARIAVAAYNGPRLTVVSGAPEAVEQVAHRAESDGLSAHRLEVQRAFHSPLMEPFLDTFRETMEAVRWRRPDLPLVSFLDPTARTAQLTEPGYWVRHAREPVAFRSGIERLVEKADLFLECGPHPVLLGMARGFLPSGARVIPSLRRGTADLRAWLRALGDLFEAGLDPDWDAWFGTRHPRVPLPGYRFQRQEYWLEHRGVAVRPQGGGSPLLGRRLFAAPLGGDDHLFESVVSRQSPAWVVDHQVFHKIVMPGAAFLELGLLAAREVRRPTALANVVIQSPLILGEAATLLQTHVAADGALSLHARAQDADEETPWTALATANMTGLGARPSAVELGPVRERLQDERSTDEFYAAFLDVGLAYGPAFQGVRSLHLGSRTALATISTGPGVSDHGAAAATSLLHPALLDACFQVTAAAIPASDRTWLPVGAGRVAVFAGVPAAVHCLVEVLGTEDPATARSLTVDVTLADDSGEVLAIVEHLQLLPATPASLLPAGAAEDSYAVEWQTVPLPATEETSVTDACLLVASRPWHSLEAALGTGSAPVVRARATDVAHLLQVCTQTPRHVVFLQDGLPHRSDAEACHALVLTLNAVAAAPLTERPSVTVVTRGASGASSDGPSSPDAAALHGVCQVAALEYPTLRVRWIDLDPRADAAETDRLLAALRATDLPNRVAFRQGQVRTPTLIPAARERRVRVPAEPFRIALRSYGSLDTLHARALTLPVEPPAGHVRVRLEASALNFKDVLYALGMLEGVGTSMAAADRQFGFEACGAIEVCGDNTTMPVGARVLVSAPGCLATHLDVPEAALMPCPDTLRSVEGATVQTVYFTALYGLERLAALQPGETVLIHAAAGGVGQAAIRVAQRVGARILATASTPKHAFLREQGIENVFDSRSAAFVDGVLAATEGKGADVVLNCLNGPLADASAKCVAKGGRFVEIGKIDVWDSARWQAERPDVRAFQFDLEEVFPADPDLLSGLRLDLAHALEDGSLAPIPHTVFPASDASAALAHLAQGHAVGKIVLRWPGPPVHPGGTYLITGGTGAVAEAMARELVRRGARHLVLSSRSADRVPDALQSELTEAGVSVRAVSGDVADPDALRALFQDCAPPVAGVVHAAGVLADAPLASLDEDALARVLAPKVDGLRNLLAASARWSELDFLLVTSSVTGWFGNPGQANYAAANTAVDALCAAAMAEGTPAYSVAFGPWAGAGMAAEVGGADGERLRERGMPPLEPAAAARAALDAVAAQRAGVAIATMRWRRFLDGWPEIPTFFGRFALDANSRVSTAQPDREDWSAVPDEERLPRVRAILTEELARVLGFADASSLPTDRAFPDLGVDSLMAVESRNRVEARLGINLAATALFDHPTVAELASYLVTCLPVAGSENGTLSPADREVDQLTELDEDELAQQLQAELDRDSDGGGPEGLS